MRPARRLESPAAWLARPAGPLVIRQLRPTPHGPRPALPAALPVRPPLERLRRSRKRARLRPAPPAPRPPGGPPTGGGPPPPRKRVRARGAPTPRAGAPHRLGGAAFWGPWVRRPRRSGANGARLEISECLPGVVEGIRDR